MSSSTVERRIDSFGNTVRILNFSSPQDPNYTGLVLYWLPVLEEVQFLDSGMQLQGLSFTLFGR